MVIYHWLRWTHITYAGCTGNVTLVLTFQGYSFFIHSSIVFIFLTPLWETREEQHMSHSTAKGTMLACLYNELLTHMHGSTGSSGVIKVKRCLVFIKSQLPNGSVRYDFRLSVPLLPGMAVSTSKAEMSRTLMSDGVQPSAGSVHRVGWLIASWLLAVEELNWPHQSRMMSWEGKGSCCLWVLMSPPWYMSAAA